MLKPLDLKNEKVIPLNAMRKQLPRMLSQIVARLSQLVSKAKGKVFRRLSASKARSRLRGTVIIDTAEGILLVSANGDRFSLPGGGAEQLETGKAAAIRELEEETGLRAISVRYLFSHVGKIRKRSSSLVRNHHEVFLIEAKGKACPRQEIKAIKFYRLGDKVDITDSARRIIKKYWEIKSSQMMDS